MRQAPNLWNLNQLKSELDQAENLMEYNGTWVPARPLGLFSITNRFRLAWLVFTGKCDAVKWPGEQ